MALLPHRRFNPLTSEWVLVSPQRTMRPWQGKLEPAAGSDRPSYDPGCYLCPGNTRANNGKNPDYTGPFVFDNDFPALLPDSGPIDQSVHPLARAEAIHGLCRVICFSPRHDLTLPLMSVREIRGVVDVWAEQTADLGSRYRWVQIFENKGEIMGCSNPHPHCQLWAGTALPNEPALEDRSQIEYMQSKGTKLLADYLDMERRDGSRIITENDHWSVVVPFWAIWPFETLLLPRMDVSRLTELDDAARNDLAGILKNLTTRYDNIFQMSFPYTMGWHGAPSWPDDTAHWQLHAHFYPPLLRSATIKKFMVGYEMLSEPQRDITAESAAEKLREMSDIHYTTIRS